MPGSHPSRNEERPAKLRPAASPEQMAFEVLHRTLDLIEPIFAGMAQGPQHRAAELATRIGRITTFVQVNQPMEMKMGDNIHDIHNSVLANRGSTATGTITVHERYGDEIGNALTSLEDVIERAGLSQPAKREALDLLEGLSSEAVRDKPSKPVLKSLGMGVLDMLKTAAGATEAITKIWPTIESLWK